MAKVLTDDIIPSLKAKVPGLYGQYTADGATANSYNAPYINSRLDGDGIHLGFGSSAGRTSALAIGASAMCNFTEAVALGHGSRANRAYEVSIGKPTGTDRTRYLANVTAGELPTDAVNLEQMQNAISESLGAVNTALTKLISGEGVE